MLYIVQSTASSRGSTVAAPAARTTQLRAVLRSTAAARPRLVSGRARCQKHLVPRAGLTTPPSAGAASPEGPNFFMPLLGETIKIVQEPIEFFEDRKKTYGPVFKTHFAGDECIVVADTALVKEVLAAEHEAVSFEIKKSIDLLTKSKMLPKNSKKAHKMDRQFLAKYFKAASIASYYPFMQSDLEKRMEKWVNGGKAIKFTEESKAFAFSVMNTQLAGVEFSEEQLEELDRLFFDFTNGATDLFAIDLPWTAFGKGKVADKGICNIIQESLEKTYGAGMKERSFSDTNMVTGFLLQKEEDGSWKYSLAETAQVMRSMLFAGHETTAGSICIMMHFITRHPEVLEEIREEQLELMERHGPVLTPEILEGTYTEAVTVECMRLQNLDKTTRIPQLLCRRALSDFEIAGKLVKKGEKILLANGYNASTVEEFLPDFEDFKPERWVIPGKSAIASYKATDTSVFGGGPRVCAGEALAWAEMKVFLALLARNVSWELVNPGAEWKRAQGSLFKNPEDGMLINFKSLSNNSAPSSSILPNGAAVTP